MARVGSSTISVNEFIRRAEYTLRPPYCRQDNYIQKKIILNSLIAEKLLALEAGDNLPMFENKRFQAYLRGRQEQSMRQWLYYHDFYRESRVEAKRVDERTALSGRTYTVRYLTSRDSNVVTRINNGLAAGESLETLYQTMSGDSALPVREVRWSQAEHESVIDALYSGQPAREDVFGPFLVDGFNTYIQIDGWTERRLLSEKEIAQRQDDVAEQMRTQKATRRFKRFVGQLMKGKRMQLHPETFKALVEILGPGYLKTQKEKESAFNQNFWGDRPQNLFQDAEEERLNAIWEAPLLQFDDQQWTVRQFYEALDGHPLVFRQRHIKQSDFAEQLKLAIADLIRDIYITKEAFKRGLDQATVVQRNQGMWRDHFSSLMQRDRILVHNNQRAVYYKHQLPVIESTLNPYFKTLRTKYNDQIFINTSAFEAIKLSGIDSHMLQRGVPFPVMVPGFPLLTTHDKLDYGSVME